MHIKVPLHSIFTNFSYFQVTPEVHLLTLMAMWLVLIQLHSHVKVMLLSCIEQFVFPQYEIIDVSWHAISPLYAMSERCFIFFLSCQHIAQFMHISRKYILILQETFFFTAMGGNFHLEETFWGTKDTMVVIAAMYFVPFFVLLSPGSSMTKKNSQQNDRLKNQFRFRLYSLSSMQSCYYPMVKTHGPCWVGWSSLHFALVCGEPWFSMWNHRS